MSGSSGAILVTGATGFLGGAAVGALERAGHVVVAGSRQGRAIASGSARGLAYGDLSREFDWSAALDGVSTVFHFAAMAHDVGSDSSTILERVNVVATRHLAEAAVRSGVARFVLVSSIGVNGSSTPGSAFREADAPAPFNAYTRSKLAAERAVLAVAKGSAMTWTILRLPMVYGSGAPGSFARLQRLVRSGLPLPLRSAKAPKSFLGINNFASVIETVARHPGAGNQLFLVSDGAPTSTAELVALMSRACGRRNRSLPVPKPLLDAIARPLGLKDEIDRLFEPLVIDNRCLREALGWSAPLTIDEELARALTA